MFEMSGLIFISNNPGIFSQRWQRITLIFVECMVVSADGEGDFQRRLLGEYSTGLGKSKMGT
jgi:hypothetical protein